MTRDPLRTTVFLAAVALVLVAVTGCTAAPPTPDDPASPSGPATATVTARTIVDAITLAPVVSSGNTYTVTTPRAGALRETPGGWTFRGQDGMVVPLAIPKTATNVSPLAPTGVDLAAFTPILEVTDSALFLVAEVTPTQMLRLGSRTPLAARARIDGSSGPFDCPLTDPRAQAKDDTYRLMCRVPAVVPAVVGATGTLVVVLAEQKDVPALPIEAVAGTIDAGEVYPVGSRSPVAVKLGVTDGTYVQVESLALGDRVRIPGPGVADR